MCSAGVEADNQFYGMLMRAAGSRGLLEPVLGLQAEMERDGLRPCAVRQCGASRGAGSQLRRRRRRRRSRRRCQPLPPDPTHPATRCLAAPPLPPHPQGTNSALMTVFVHNGRLGEAQAIFKRLRAAGEWPQIYAMNALLNAYAAAHR